MASKGGKKGRKFDRNRGSNSNKAYKAGNRLAVNKKKRVERAKKDEGKKMKVKRGTARYIRRHGSLLGFGFNTPLERASTPT